MTRGHRSVSVFLEFLAEISGSVRTEFRSYVGGQRGGGGDENEAHCSARELVVHGFQLWWFVL